MQPEAVPIGDVDISWMVGCVLAMVEFSAPSHWTIALASGGSVRTDGLWRLVVGGRLTLTSEDRGHRFGLSEPVDVAAELRLAASSKVVQAFIEPGTWDLILRFEGDVELELVTTSTGYEAWQVENPNGGCVVVDGSGNASSWRSRD
jgi:hypothetical protein